MQRYRNTPPAYRKHKASGQAVVNLSGKIVYLGKWQSAESKEKYNRLITEWLAQGKTQPVSVSSITINELTAKYWKFAKGYYQKDGRCTRVTPGIKCALRYLKKSYGRTPAAEFGPLALKAIREQMIGEGLSRRYINDHIDRIRRMFRWGAQEELVSASVHQALCTVPSLKKNRTKARETAPVKPVEETTVNATLPHLPEVVADLVRFQRYTGCRPSEACLLRPCDVDRSGDVWTYIPESHKTEHHGRPRVIPIGPKAQAILLKYMARDPQMHCFRPCDSEAKRLAELHKTRTTPLSCGNKPGSNCKPKPKRKPGTRYRTDSYRKAIQRGCDKAEIERWSPNQLRHTAATEIRKQFGLEAAQIVLGHSQADVTQVYAERDLQKGYEVARKIG